MRKILVTTLGISLLSLLSIWGNPVPIKGSWDKSGPRSIIQVPAPPTASIEGGELAICLTDALSDLMITVTDSNGSVVYQEVVSGKSGYTLMIPLSSGSYTLTLEHREYGVLSGEFIVE